MNREVIFRGKLSHSGEWVLGSLLKIDNRCHIVTESDMYEDGHHIRQESDTPTWVDADTVGEFTGLRDKNGVKVFEGDVVHMVWYDTMFSQWREKTVLVEFKWGRFTVFWLKPYEHSDKHYFEVIGNIFDNPELLNKK